MSATGSFILGPNYLDSPARGIQRELLAALTTKRRDQAAPTSPSAPIFDLTAADHKQVLKIFRRHQQNVTNLAAAYKGKSKKAFATARTRWLKQLPTRVSAAVRALAKSRQIGVTFADVMKLAAVVDVWKVLDEKVTIVVHPKPAGGY